MAYETRESKGREHWLKFREECIRKRRDGKTLTLDETAAAIWDPDTEEFPMSGMGVLKIEKRALEKIKAKLRESKIYGLDDVFESKTREYGRDVSSIYGRA